MLAVVCAIPLIEIITLGNIGIETPFRTVACSFYVVTVFGVLEGLRWLKVLGLVDKGEEDLQGQLLFFRVIRLIFLRPAEIPSVTRQKEITHDNGESAYLG